VNRALDFAAANPKHVRTQKARSASGDTHGLASRKVKGSGGQDEQLGPTIAQR
jgi:hypothetical protein